MRPQRFVSILGFVFCFVPLGVRADPPAVEYELRRVVSDGTGSAANYILGFYTTHFPANDRWHGCKSLEQSFESVGMAVWNFSHARVRFEFDAEEQYVPAGHVNGVSPGPLPGPPGHPIHFKFVLPPRQYLGGFPKDKVIEFSDGLENGSRSLVDQKYTFNMGAAVCAQRVDVRFSNIRVTRLDTGKKFSSKLVEEKPAADAKE